MIYLYSILSRYIYIYIYIYPGISYFYQLSVFIFRTFCISSISTLYISEGIRTIFGVHTNDLINSLRTH